MKTILSLIILAASSTTVLAADLSKPLPVKAVAEPVFSWTGFYIGGTAGYSFDNEHSFENRGNDAHTQSAIASGSHAASITNSSDGFTGGVELGYNYQIPNTAAFGAGGVVIGLEADLEYVGPGSSTVYKYTASSPTEYYSSDTKFLSTVRARLGYAFGNLLVYGTGGWAFGQVQDERVIVSPSGLASYADRSKTGSGYAVGGGLAYAIPTSAAIGKINMTAAVLKAEYLYYDLGSMDMLVPAPNPAHSFTSSIGVTGNLVRFGIDFKFN